MVLSPPGLDDAYGVGAEQLLEPLQARARACADDFVEAFYSALSAAAWAKEVLERLDARQMRRLRRSQAEHLLLLMRPDLDALSHREHALHVGEVHAHVGVDLHGLIEACGLYQHEMHRIASEGMADDRRRGEVLRVLNRRLLLDVEAQSAAYHALDERRAAALADVHRAVQQAGNLQDLYAGVLQALARLPVLRAAFVARPSTQGWLEVEASAGEAADAYLAAMQGGVIPRLRVGEEHVVPRGPAALAWATGEICVVDAYAKEPDLAPWRAVALRLGMRASVAVPLLDEAGHAFAIVSLYGALPGCFSSATRRAFLSHVQQAVGPSALRHAQGGVLPYAQRLRYAERVRAGRVRMLYQPIVSLADGRLLKVEALARLLDEDGTLLSPGAFLAALGQDKLLRLFELGLRQACCDQQAWRAQGLDVRVALNLPPQGVCDPRYRDTLLDILRECGADARRIELEILETSDAGDSAMRETFFAELRALGMRVVQDDLGSGHSSLLRMDSMPFDAVKIDQALVLRAARRNPQRALEFIHHLTQLAHALEVPVTVEGLEDRGLLEAAAILGADSGQGYAIARPMPAAMLRAWLAAFEFGVDVHRPRTALGALAGQLLWDRQLTALQRWPEMVEDFVRARSLLQEYLDHAPAPALADLVERHRALALGGGASRLYARSRRKLIEALSALVGA